MPADKIASAVTAVQVAAGGGAVTLTFSSVDLVVKLIGAGVALTALLIAQYWNWRRDVRERKEHSAEMERHRVEMERIRQEMKE